ncbi:MAG: HEPN domain-containing protein [Candidatus Aenigmatarchaeota archaeon]
MSEFSEKAKKWIEKAIKDLESSKVLYNSENYEYSLFHSQQAVEKFLKAFLTFHNKPFPKTHNIAKLIEMCKEIDKEFDKLYEIEADKLYPIGMDVRYPIDVEISEEEAKEAIEIAEKVKEFVLNKLKINDV